MSDKLLEYEDDPVLHSEIVAAMPDKPQFTLSHHKAKLLGHLPESLAIHFPGQKPKRETSHCPGYLVSCLWFPVESNRGCLSFRSESEKDADASDGMTSDGVASDGMTSDEG